MAISDKTIDKIAGQLGMSVNSTTQNIVHQWEKKSDDELLSEIKTLQKKLEANNISQNQQLALIKKLMPMLGSNEKARLQNIIVQLGLKL